MTTLLPLSGKTSHLLCDRLFKQSSRIIRGIKFLRRIRSNLILDKSQHKIVYDFRGIILPVAILKSKVWVVPLTFAMAPVAYILDGIASSIICVLTACSYGSTGLLLSKATENMVGKIYVNKDGDVKDVIVSSVNRMGQRIDRVHHLSEFINYDFPSKIHRSLGFIAIGVENSTTVYKVNVRNCKLIDPGMCTYLFGNIWQSNVQEENKTNEETKHKSEKVQSNR